MTNANISATGMRIMRLLIGKRPQSLADLMEAIGVTRTAVTEQLNLLMRAGYVTRTQERSGRGRPRHLYMATDEAQQLFPSNEELFVPAVLRALREIAGEETTQQVLARVSEQLAHHYQARVHGDTPQQRLEHLSQVLRRDGFLVEVSKESGHWVLRERSCPFWPMVDEARSACEVEQQMMSNILQAPVRLSQCRLDGCADCVFELDLPDEETQE